MSVPLADPIDFRAQAEQMLKLIESKLESNQRKTAIEFLNLKFKTIFEEGVVSGRRYEREGVYPYQFFTTDAF